MAAWLAPTQPAVTLYLSMRGAESDHLPDTCVYPLSTGAGTYGVVCVLSFRLTAVALLRDCQVLPNACSQSDFTALVGSNAALPPPPPRMMLLLMSTTSCWLLGVHIPPPPMHQTPSMTALGALASGPWHLGIQPSLPCVLIGHDRWRMEPPYTGAVYISVRCCG